jgi:hypothetical protein
MSDRSSNDPNSAADFNAVKKALKEVYDELSPASQLFVGEDIREMLTYHHLSPSFPWLCQNQPDTTIQAATVPDLASAMRNFKLRMKPWSDNISTWDVTAQTSNGIDTGTLTFKKNSSLSGTVTAADSATLTFSTSQSLTVGDILILSTGAIVRVISGSGTSWVVDIKVTISAGTARIATMEELMIRALYYAQEKHSSYTEWFCLTLTSAIGNIAAGDYLITGLSVVSNTISIATTAATGSGSGAWNDQVEIYPFRIPSSINARHYSWAGHAMVTAGGDEYTLVAGILRLDYMQIIKGAVYPYGVGRSDALRWSADEGAMSLTQGSYGDKLETGSLGLSIQFDSSKSQNARAGKRTHGADVGLYTYIYAGTVAA